MSVGIAYIFTDIVNWVVFQNQNLELEHWYLICYVIDKRTKAFDVNNDFDTNKQIWYE